MTHNDVNDVDVQVLRTSLRGLAPKPTWNGTVAASPVSEAGSGHCSLLCENGDVVVLRAQSSNSNSSRDDADCTSLHVDKIVRAPPATAAATSMGDDAAKCVCQCWSADGSVFATAHSRCVTFYSATQSFALLQRVQLRFIVTSIAIAPIDTSSSEDSSTNPLATNPLAYHLVVGTAFGAHLYKLALEPATLSNQPDGDASQPAILLLQPCASVYSDAPVCNVAYAPDSHTIALGTVDGRVFVRELLSAASPFGSEAVAFVLASPRVTSLSFSPCSSMLAVATRKGHVYVFVTAASSSGYKWQLHAPCRALTETPKAPIGATNLSSSASSATAMQTLVCWWGTAAAAVLVVASRAVNYCIELVDVTSGALVHTVRIESPSSSSSSATDDDLLIGLCSIAVPTGMASSSLRLVCQDTRPSLALVSWPMLDVWSSAS